MKRLLLLSCLAAVTLVPPSALAGRRGGGGGGFQANSAPHPARSSNVSNAPRSFAASQHFKGSRRQFGISRNQQMNTRSSLATSRNWAARSGISRNGISRSGISRTGISRSRTSRTGISRSGISRSGTSRNFSSDSRGSRRGTGRNAEFRNRSSSGRASWRDWSNSKSCHWSSCNWGHRNHRHCDDDRIIFISAFGYPFYSSLWYPYWGYDSYYPYEEGYYPYESGSGYEGSGYEADGYGDSVVVQVQRRLAEVGYYKGPIDGIMGSRTEWAIRAYERANGLRVDGTINDQLLQSMGLR